MLEQRSEKREREGVELGFCRWWCYREGRGAGCGDSVTFHAGVVDRWLVVGGAPSLGARKVKKRGRKERERTVADGWDPVAMREKGESGVWAQALRVWVCGAGRASQGTELGHACVRCGAEEGGAWEKGRERSRPTRDGPRAEQKGREEGGRSWAIEQAETGKGRREKGRVGSRAGLKMKKSNFSKSNPFYF